MDNAPNRKNWLERNPKKVIGAIVLLAIGGLAVATEKLLARKNHGLIHPTGIQRYIKLREFNPLYRDVLVPNQEAMRMSDGLAQKPFVLRVDRQGFIMPAKIHDHPDLTIAFLGGSTTECVYVNEPDRFPYLAGRLLERQTHLKVNSYNAGRSGNNTLHCINVLINKVVNLKPDIVVHQDDDVGLEVHDFIDQDIDTMQGVVAAAPGIVGVHLEVGLAFKQAPRQVGKPVRLIDVNAFGGGTAQKGDGQVGVVVNFGGHNKALPVHPEHEGLLRQAVGHPHGLLVGHQDVPI